MTVYIVIGLFVVASLGVIGTLMLAQPAISRLRAINREGERRREPRD
jgi:hypothetical protein